MADDITVLLAGRLPTFPIRRRGQLKVGSMLKLKQFASVVIHQRAEIVNTVKRWFLKSHDPDWLEENFSDGSVLGVSSAVLVSGKIVRTAIEEHTESWRKDLDEFYKLAINEAAGLPAASHILGELKSVYEAHSVLINEAIESAQTFSGDLPSYPRHDEAIQNLRTLISGLPAERESLTDTLLNLLPRLTKLESLIIRFLWKPRKAIFSDLCGLHNTPWPDETTVGAQTKRFESLKNKLEDINGPVRIDFKNEVIWLDRPDDK